MGRKDNVNDVVDMSIPSINIKCKNPKQKEFTKAIEDNQITICSGPAGTGKSYLSVAKALQLIKQDNPYHTLIIVNPAVEAEEKLGYLKGDMHDKLAPYTFSTMELVDKVIGPANRKALQHEGNIKVMALAYMRGWNCDNSILVMEEAQNMTTGQMKTLLTRIGSGTKFIISGDMEQSDRFKDTKMTGLFEAIGTLGNMEDIGIVEFEIDDVVRNPIISKILHRYEEAKEPKEIKLKPRKQIDFFAKPKKEIITECEVVKPKKKKHKPSWYRKLHIFVKKQWRKF